MVPTAVKDSLASLVVSPSLAGRDVVPVTQAPLKLSLPAAVALIREQNAHFQSVTRNKADFHEGLFIRADRWCAAVGLDRAGSNARLTVGLIGCVGALAATLGYHVAIDTEPTGLTALVGAAMIAPFMGSRFAVAGIEALAERSKKNALRRQVQLDAVQPHIASFRESSGVDKALRGTVLMSWFDSMDTCRALSGPARVELLRVKQELEACNVGDRNDAQRLFTLQRMVDEKGDVSGSDVDAIASQIETASADERAALARGVVQLLDENSRDVDYQPAHKLHELTLEQP